MLFWIFPHYGTGQVLMNHLGHGLKRLAYQPYTESRNGASGRKLYHIAFVVGNIDKVKFGEQDAVILGIRPNNKFCDVMIMDRNCESLHSPQLTGINWHLQHVSFMPIQVDSSTQGDTRTGSCKQNRQYSHVGLGSNVLEPADLHKLAPVGLALELFQGFQRMACERGGSD
ncbi:hypothetical protein BJV78DRAFT_153418 [Lactifluus subvellereus]|nr:hypothetical protein BJV78DRAFT_153418 [Lactifluus subvellereus]